MKKVAVFCSSSTTLAPIFLSEAESLGRDLAKAGFEVVYGGASLGPMGALAEGALRAKGKVFGVIPKLDFAQGIVQPGLTRQIEVSTLSERKTLMLSEADAVVAFPGGLGTLDEVTDCLVLKQIGEWQKPIWFYNLLSFWDPFLETLTLMQESRMISCSLDKLYAVAETREELVKGLRRGINS